MGNSVSQNVEGRPVSTGRPTSTMSATKRTALKMKTPGPTQTYQGDMFSTDIFRPDARPITKKTNTVRFESDRPNDDRLVFSRMQPTGHRPWTHRPDLPSARPERSQTPIITRVVSPVLKQPDNATTVQALFEPPKTQLPPEPQPPPEPQTPPKPHTPPKPKAPAKAQTSPTVTQQTEANSRQNKAVMDAYTAFMNKRKKQDQTVRAKATKGKTKQPRKEYADPLTVKQTTYLNSREPTKAKDILSKKPSVVQPNRPQSRQAVPSTVKPQEATTTETKQIYIPDSFELTKANSGNVDTANFEGVGHNSESPINAPLVNEVPEHYRGGRNQARVPLDRLDSRFNSNGLVYNNTPLQPDVVVPVLPSMTDLQDTPYEPYIPYRPRRVFSYMYPRMPSVPSYRLSFQSKAPSYPFMSMYEPLPAPYIAGSWSDVPPYGPSWRNRPTAYESSA